MSSSSASDQATIYQRPVELLQKLIRFDTSNPPGNEAECVKYINDLLTGAGFEATIIAKAPNRPNLVVRLKGQGNAAPLLLYGHVDVQITKDQTWQHPPFEGKIVDGYVWGRGALDMKGGVAMMLAAFLRAKAEGLTPAGDVVLALLCDEECFGDFGASYLVETHPELFKNIRYALGEFGGFTLHISQKKFYPIQVAEKQICLMKAVVRGPGGHGSMPLHGGAMAKLGHVLQQLDQRRLPAHITPVARQMVQMVTSALTFPANLILRQLLNPKLTDRVLKLLGTQGQAFDPLLHNTVNATIVHGGNNFNVIPSEIALNMDGRLLPGYSPDDMVVELRQVVGDQVELEVLRYDPCPAKPDMGLFSTLAGILQEADPGGLPVPMLLPAVTDGRFFSTLGIQTYGFTPMKLPADLSFTQSIHAADERIPVEAVDFGTDAIYKALQRFGK
jgi:acetylornithine deacetylase/succinyl-diaminopimelate desuccinylase-like protein